jgi:hypothetical protein
VVLYFRFVTVSERLDKVPHTIFLKAHNLKSRPTAFLPVTTKKRSELNSKQRSKMRLHPIQYGIFILVLAATCFLSMYILILAIADAKPHIVSITPFKNQDRNLKISPPSSLWKSVEGNLLESKILLSQSESEEKEAGNSKRPNPLSPSPLSLVMSVVEPLHHERRESLGSKVSEVDSLSILGGVMALLFLVFRAKEKIHKQKRFRHLREFTHGSSDHDLMLDISYGNSQANINYGSFVPIQMGDLEKYDI